MALLIRDTEIVGLVSIEEAIAAIREGYRDQGEMPAFSAPRLRIQHQDRRLSVHTGGCHGLGVSGAFLKTSHRFGTESRRLNAGLHGESGSYPSSQPGDADQRRSHRHRYGSPIFLKTSLLPLKLYSRATDLISVRGEFVTSLSGQTTHMPWRAQ